MDNGEITSILKKEYEIDSIEILKLKNIYKIKTLDKEYCLKVIRYELPHLMFILGAMNHLQEKQFDKVPKFIKTTSNKDFIEFGTYYAYLIPWLKSRVSNYDNPYDLQNAAQKLAELHLCSRSFQVQDNMKPRDYWYQWINNFETRNNEILDFKKRINQKAKKTDFDKLYEEMIEDEFLRGEKSIEELKLSGYMDYMKEESKELGFCHHDYAHHNVLVGEDNKIIIIDFDYCILDSHLHDLASLLIRAMKDGNWSLYKSYFILENYNKVNKVFDKDIPIISGFMRYPQQFWQIGIQYYWEMQDWGEEFFIKKLLKYKDDIDEREEFLDKFMKTSVEDYIN